MDDGNSVFDCKVQKEALGLWLLIQIDISSRTHTHSIPHKLFHTTFRSHHTICFCCTFAIFFIFAMIFGWQTNFNLNMMLIKRVINKTLTLNKKLFKKDDYRRVLRAFWRRNKWSMLNWENKLRMEHQRLFSFIIVSWFYLLINT